MPFFSCGLSRPTKGGIALIWRSCCTQHGGNGVILSWVLTSHTARGRSWCGSVRGLSDWSHRRQQQRQPEDVLESSQAASQSCWTGSSGLGPAISVLVCFLGGFWCLITTDWVMQNSTPNAHFSVEWFNDSNKQTDICCSLKGAGGWTGCQSGPLYAVIQGLRVMKVLPSLLCDFQGCLEVIPAKREEHGERAEGCIPGLVQKWDMLLVAIVHCLELSHVALLACRGGCEMSSSLCWGERGKCGFWWAVSSVLMNISEVLSLYHFGLILCQKLLWQPHQSSWTDSQNKENTKEINYIEI